MLRRLFIVRILWGTTALAIVGAACGLPSLAFAQQKAPDKNFAEKIAEWLPGGKFAAEKGKAFGNWGTDKIREVALYVLLEVTAGIVYVLYLLSLMIDPLLIGGSFLTNPLVQGGWPFVLGIANLGFVLALLFIAASTILGLGGFNVRQALVRLLIAAVLINFSLLIAGVILDASRLLMAVILKAVGDINGGALGIELLMGSKLFQNAFSIFLSPFGPAVTPSLSKIAGPGLKSISVMDSLLAMWLAAGVTIIFAILVISLLTRWLMLVFLLIVSPLAYLAYATPQLDKYARQWWSSFFSYVIYGPVVAFILAIAVRVGDELSIYFQNLLDGRKNIPNFISLVVTLGVIFLATRAGKFLSLAGAEKIAGSAMAVGSFARRHPFLVGGAVAGPVGVAAVTGAKVGTKVAKGTVKYGKEFLDEAAFAKFRKTRDAMKKVVAGTAKPEDLKEVDKSPISRTIASALSVIPGLGGRLSTGSQLAEWKAREEAGKGAIAQARRGTTGAPPTDAEKRAALAAAPELDPKLKLSEFDHNLSVKDLTFMLEFGTQEHKKVILQDPSVMKKLEEDSSGKAMLQSIESAPTQREDRERLDINQVRIDLRDRIQRQQPGLSAAQLNQRVEYGLGASVDLERRRMAPRNQRIDAENEQRKNNKELIDAIGKAKDAMIKKQRGEF